MSYTVNELFAATAHLVLPFVLMEAPENMDFVKDATCALFIAQLDTLQVVAPEHENPLEGEELQRAQDDQDEFPGKEEKELPLLKVEIPIPGRVMKKRKERKRATQEATIRDMSSKRSFRLKRCQLFNRQLNRCRHCHTTLQICSFQHQFDA